MPGRREVLLSAMAVGCLAGCLDDDAGDVDGGEQFDEGSSDDASGADDDPGAAGSDGADDHEEESSDDSGDDEGPEGDETDGDDEATDDDETDEVADNAPRDHPLAGDLGAYPTRGDPETATATILEVSDVSCPLCREFHEGAYEELSAEYIDDGDLAHVYLAVPGLDTGWNVPATHALYELLEREGESAFWSLAEFYYREQEGLGEDDVLERTEEYLSRITEEVEAVIDAAETEEHSGMIEGTIAAATEAGIEGVPTFYLFREGEYLTTIEGNQSVEVFENALSL